jgi:hypothetical protein
MNERIKALAVEADFMLCEDGHFYSEGQSQKITDGLQKFAELIVRECANHALTFNNNIQSLNDKEIRSHSSRVSDYIKDRMGVEE